MAKMTVAQWRQYAKQWERAAPELKRIHDEELANWKYDSKVVDALLEIGANSPKRREDESNGLFEMQKWFIKIAQKQRLKPSMVREAPAPYGTPELSILGEKAILNRPRLALFCSVKCPGKLILEAYDLCQRLREQGVTVVGGFHSPMEQECMRILLKSRNRVVWCLARGLMKRPPPEFTQAVVEGRLLILSLFKDCDRRQTTETATRRNLLVADIAAACVVVHAAPGSKVEALCRDLLASSKPLYTFDHQANAAIITAGARTIAPRTNWKEVIEPVEG